jgi:hypothetical protein
MTAAGIALFSLLFLAFMGLATALHASSHGKSKLWGVVVVFTGALGLIIYAISLASD